MPAISRFYGIVISFYFNDHNPPHFHAQYAGSNAEINILDGTVRNSSLPKRQLKMVLAWAEIHRDELMENWELARAGKDLNPIPPLR
ncbi:MAG: DUF4160 domain-containing protein [Clostridiales bacterium]|jgi:hypothetical protein|nr:DUF4160 domain-containing protein [Clostridiales bacterium]